MTDLFCGDVKSRPVRIYRTALEIKNGVSSTKTMKGAVIETAGWEVKDVKFIDDGELLLAVSANCKLADGLGLTRFFS